MVRPSPPRFLNFGDRFELPVVVQNQTDAPMTVDVAVRAAQRRARPPGAGRRARACRRTIASRCASRRPRRAPARRASRSAPRPGTRRRRRRGRAAGLDAGHHRGLRDLRPDRRGRDRRSRCRRPPASCREFGGLEVTTSSTALQALTDAVLYLVAYPFECAEQLSSRVLAVAALRDVLAAFQAEGLPQARRDRGGGEARPRAPARAAERRRRLRLLAPRRRARGPTSRIHVAHALARAKAKGFAVPDDDARALAATTCARSSGTSRREYGQDVRRTLQRLRALRARRSWATADPARARALVARGRRRGACRSRRSAGSCPCCSKDAGARRPRSRPSAAASPTASTETAGAAHFAASYGDGAHLLLHSDRRADAILLEALIADQPKSDLIPKLVRGPARPPHGRPLGEHAGERLRPARARPLLPRLREGDARLRGPRLAGRALRRRARVPRAARPSGSHLAIPMAVPAAKGRARATCCSRKEGPGRLYYRIGLRYAPDEPRRSTPLDHGFTVERTLRGASTTRSDVRARRRRHLAHHAPARACACG